MSDNKANPTIIETIWEGTWGSITPSPHAAETVRFCKVDKGIEVELVSYPYHCLGCWRWRKGDPEQITIEMGSEITIEITGRGLKRLMEALDHGQLQLVREQGDNHAEGNLCVYSIYVNR